MPNSLLKHMRNGKDVEHMKKIMPVIKEYYENYLRIEKEHINPNPHALIHLQLKWIRENHSDVCFWLYNHEIYKKCKIPRSSYYQVIKKMVANELLLQVPYFESPVEGFTSYNLIAVTKNQLALF